MCVLCVFLFAFVVVHLKWIITQKNFFYKCKSNQPLLTLLEGAYGEAYIYALISQ